MFIVYHITSTMEEARYQTERWAKWRVAKLGTRYSYTSVDDYNNLIVKPKKVINLMTGTEVEIPSNTPLCCDPSSETYWSM